MMQAVPNTFLYFAYGSNLLKRRIHINNPSAEFMGIGKLLDHQLDFIKSSLNWRGCSATIVPTKDAHVWGAIWRIHNDDMESLDKQEGVDTKWYFAKLVEVVLPAGLTVECRTYQQTINPEPRSKDELLSKERLPSKTYMEVIIRGAMECNMPKYYIEFLKSIQHNNKEASPEMMNKLKKIAFFERMRDLRKPGHFLYFAYGSNILRYRMKMHCPSAEFVSIARADNYRLDFHKYNKFWGGPEATIVPTANAHVWGVVWRVNIDDKISFDDHRGMDMKKYFLKHIDVLTPYIGYIHCSVYIQRINPLPVGDNDPIPVERWPSWTYREVMVAGAKEHEMPPFYIEFLSNLKNNGEEGMLRVSNLCERYGRDKPCECWVPEHIPRKPLKFAVQEVLGLRAIRKANLDEMLVVFIGYSRSSMTMCQPKRPVMVNHFFYEAMTVSPIV
ncbi:AIG2-like family domain-containing protein [Phthorimaea operculella]|nr:AIG2-like family domain-containing protein [Phthorimaea operculella]